MTGKRRTRSKKKDRNRSPVTIAGVAEWDRTLKEGDLVVCSRDYPVLHVYKLVELTRRYIYPEDLLNHPSLHLQGKNVGDEYAPLALLRLHRAAPDFRLVGNKPAEKTVDGFLVFPVRSADLDPLIQNISALKKEIDADSVHQG